jgi:simple sugar transport system permease protein
MGIFDVAFLVSAVTIAAPILLAATGELVSEKAGVINVGLEGVMLSGAFTAYWTMTGTGNMFVSFVGGLAGGLLFGVLMAVLAVEAKVDQIVSGIAIGLLGYGITTFLNSDAIKDPKTFAPMQRHGIPGLEDLPVVGRAFFDQDLFIYVTAIVVVLVALAMSRTTWGVNLKAVGETPIAVDAAGVSVRGLRWAATLISAGCAGIAGAYISIGDVGVFRESMTGGRGYLALAAVLFGRWRLRGVGLAVTIFAVTDATQLRLQALGEIPREVWIAAAAIVVLVLALRARVRAGIRPTGGDLFIGAVLVALVITAIVAPRTTLPVPLWLAMPYVLALVALATAGNTRNQAPTALAIPYLRSEA